MSPDQQIGKYTPGPHVALFATTFCVGLEGSPREQPNLLSQCPVNRNSSLFEK